MVFIKRFFYNHWLVVEVDIDMDLDEGGHTPVAEAPAQGVG